MLVALIFVLMGIISERFATRLIYFEVMLYSVGGVVGTLHHCYFSGGPAVEMALGAFFSAAEVIPLTLLTVEAWSFLQLGSRQHAGRTRRSRIAGRCCSWPRSGFGTSWARGSSGSSSTCRS